MTVSTMLEEFRSQFPEAAARADKEHEYLWGKLCSESEFAWFESLAKSINSQMNSQAPTETTKEIFRFFEKRYAGPSEAVRKCIDTSFVENLFWHIPEKSAAAYWAALPNSLQDLYVNFHASRPT